MALGRPWKKQKKYSSRQGAITAGYRGQKILIRVNGLECCGLIRRPSGRAVEDPMAFRFAPTLLLGGATSRCRLPDCCKTCYSLSA